MVGAQVADGLGRTALSIGGTSSPGLTATGRSIASRATRALNASHLPATTHALTTFTNLGWWIALAVHGARASNLYTAAGIGVANFIGTTHQTIGLTTA